MGQGFRRNRLESEIVKETSQILLFELRDPRKGFVTVTKAKVSDDYHYAKVFVSVMGTAKEKRLTMKGLQHAQGFVQKELSRRIKMRSFPEVHFELDESLDKAMSVQKMIDDVAKERKAREAAAAGPASASDDASASREEE
jgi:ribosome-binding factor A